MNGEFWFDAVRSFIRVYISLSKKRSNKHLAYLFFVRTIRWILSKFLRNHSIRSIRRKSKINCSLGFLRVGLTYGKSKKLNSEYVKLLLVHFWDIYYGKILFNYILIYVVYFGFFLPSTYKCYSENVSSVKVYFCVRSLKFPCPNTFYLTSKKNLTWSNLIFFYDQQKYTLINNKFSL